MSINKKVYDLGKIELKDLDVPVIRIEIKKPNSTIIGEILGVNASLEIVLCTIEESNKIIPLNIIKVNSKIFKFTHVLIGQYFILNKNSKELNLNSNNNITQSEVVSFETEYNFVNAKFENQAKLYNDWAIWLGGHNNGSATVQVQVEQDGIYDFNIEYLGPKTRLKIDINGTDTSTYTMPSEYQGFVSIKLKLKKGNNQVKFYNNYPDKAPDLYKFKIQKYQTTTDYNLINGILKNGATVNTSLNMVIGLGGINKGEANINIDIANAGKYGLTIKYNKGLRAFLIDVNGKNTEMIYVTPTKLKGEYYLEIDLIKGNNQLRFYGIDTKLAPDLGDFKIAVVQNPLPPINSKYSVTRGVLENGAKLSKSKKCVVNLGGSKNGSATVTVYEDKAGRYNLKVKFFNGCRYLKIDINNNPLNETFLTPQQCYGYFTTVVNLKAGTNEIKFYGLTTEYASNLGDFDLEFIEQVIIPPLPPGTYDSTEGVLENGAEIEYTNRFVKNLGGTSDGSARLNINLSEEGNYEVAINYLSYSTNSFLSVGVNKVNVGIYNVDMTEGNLNDVKTFTIRTLFNSGNNEIKFHGDGTNPAPSIGTFTLIKIPDPIPPPPPPVPPVPPTPIVTPPYTFDKLNTLSYTDLVNFIRTIQWDEVPIAIRLREPIKVNFIK